jgi:hypothetical protein
MFLIYFLRVCPLAKAIWCNVLTMEVRTKFFCVIARVDSYINLSRELGKGKLMNGEDHDSVFVHPTQTWKVSIWIILLCYMKAMHNKDMYNI